jgi:NTE family protein
MHCCLILPRACGARPARPDRRAGSGGGAAPDPQRRGLVLALPLLAGGCTIATDADHDGPDAPAAAALAPAPRVAWVFGSGGPRGFVHVGVLKALDELALRPDAIVGASAGAVVGALYAGGMSAAAIEELALSLEPWRLLRVAVGGDERLSGRAIAELIRSRVPEPLLERFRTPMVCVAQRLADGAVVGFTRGDAGIAVQASAAIEGQFAPVRIRGQRYADADQRMPLPVRLARALGAVRVLAVDASAHEDRTPPGAEEYRELDRRKRELTRPDAALADLLLHPEFGYWAGMSRAYRLRVIEAGYRATMAVAGRAQRLHRA